MSEIQEITEAIERLKINARVLEGVINGPVEGSGSEVELPLGGVQITLARAMAQLNDVFSLPDNGEQGQTLLSDGQGGVTFTDADIGRVANTGTNYINDTTNQKEVNIALDSKLKEVFNAVIPAAPSNDDINSVAIENLKTLVPDEVGEEVITFNGVTFISTGTNAGDWEVLVQKETVILGDNKYRQGACENVTIQTRGYGVASAIFGGVPYAWGDINQQGSVPVPTNAGSLGSPRRFAYKQHSTRPHPDFNISEIGIIDKIKKVHFQHFDFGHCLTESGMVFGWARTGAEVAHMMGTNGVSEVYESAAPIFFDDGSGTNVPIRDFATSSHIASTAEMYGGLYVGQDDSLWVMTDNHAALTLNSAIPSTGTTAPTRVQRVEWLGLTIKKVRVTDGGRNYYVHFSDGTLWACGHQDLGEFGLGNTTDQVGWVQIASDVKCFDVSIDSHTVDQYTYYIGNDNILRAAGDNGSGWMGRGNVTNVNTFVEVASDVERVVSGGSGTYHAIAILKTDGLWYRAGNNQNGAFGNSSIAIINTVELWTELNNLISEHGALIDIIINQHWTLGVTQTALLFQDGKIFIAGRGVVGQLGDGEFSNATTHVESFANLDYGEIPVGLGATNSPVGEPHVYFTTNRGNVYMTGDVTSGFSNSLPRSTDEITGGDRSVFEKINLTGY